MKFKNWRDVIKADWPELGPIIDETVEHTQRYASRYSSAVREATGRIWTDEAYESRRKRVLSTPLP